MADETKAPTSEVVKAPTPEVEKTPDGRKIVRDLSQVSAADQPAQTTPPGARPARPGPQITPTDMLGYNIKKLHDSATGDRDFFHRLWEFLDNLKPSDNDARRLRDALQAICRRFRDQADQALTGIMTSEEYKAMRDEEKKGAQK